MAGLVFYSISGNIALRALLLFLLLSSTIVPSASATQSVTLSWDQNPEPDIAGYRLHYGTATGAYTETLDVGNVTTVTVSDLLDTASYFFVVTAFNTAGLESLPSNEATFTPAVALVFERRVYAGLIEPGEAGGVRGAFTMTVAAGGAVTGRIMVDGENYRWRGALGPDGTLALTIDRPEPLTDLTLTVMVDQTARRVSGTIDDGQFSSNVDADAAMIGDGRDTVPENGRYTVALLPDGANPADPQGYGFATMTVSKRGEARVAGTLADGAKFSFGRVVTNDGVLPVYIPLYDRLGWLFGSVTFRDNPAVSDADAILRWSKPARPADPHFPAGFAIDVPLRAARFSCTKDAPVLPGLVQSAGHATLSFIGGGEEVAEAPDQLLLFSPSNQPVVFPPNEPKVSVTFRTRTGHWSGRFTTPAGIEHSFRGVLYQKGAGCGYGLFVGATQSGAVVLEPGTSETPTFNEYGLRQWNGSYYTNTRGQQEKYLVGTASANGYSELSGYYWYYILPSGDLYEFAPPYSNTALTGIMVARLGTAYYLDPSLLTR